MIGAYRKESSLLFSEHVLEGQKSLGHSHKKKKGIGIHHFPPLPLSINKATCGICIALTTPNLSPIPSRGLYLPWYYKSPVPENNLLPNTACPASAYVFDSLPPIHSWPEYIQSGTTSLTVYK